jgi:hypothetical protein
MITIPFEGGKGKRLDTYAELKRNFKDTSLA